MNGQPINDMLKLDVTTVKVLRESEPVMPDDWNVLPIVDEREEFELAVEFSLSGVVWDWILIAAERADKTSQVSARFEISAYAAGGHIQLFNEAIPLDKLDTKLQGPRPYYTYIYSYKFIVPKDTVTVNGVYNIETMLTFESNETKKALHGLLGFTESLKMLIHEREDKAIEGHL